MSKIAKATGIGRATLYKYFPDVEAILLAWHERQIDRHLSHLAAVRDGVDNPAGRLLAVLEAYGLILRDHPASEAAALLHRGEHMARAEHHLAALVRDLIADCVRSGNVRDDVPSDELASFTFMPESCAQHARKLRSDDWCN